MASDTSKGSERCHINTLSTELILRIIDYVPFESHLDFACTCKQIFSCSSDILKRHNGAYNEYRVVSDLDPATVPTLLRSAFGLSDPILAWHVRSIEIWRDRRNWREWKPYAFQQSLEEDTETEPLAWNFLYGEVEAYLELLEYGNSTSELLELARTQIEDGNDGCLKAVLLANCPRIRDAKFVTPGMDQAFDDASCLGWLEILIRDAVRGANPWPLGLDRLQNVAVGIPTETWMDSPISQTQRAEPSNSYLLIELLRLPSIESLYFRGYVRWDDDDVDFSDHLPAECSTLKHLFMDGCDEMSHSFREALSEAPKELVTLSFRAGPAYLEHADSIVSNFGSNQGNTLESLMFYGCFDHDQIHGYRCSAFRPEELENYHVLRNVSINVQDVELDAYYTEQHDKEEDESLGQYLERYFANCFPESMQTLMLWDELGSKYICWEPSDEVGLENAVIKMIESERYEELKAIFLEEIERPRYDQKRQGPRKDAVCFRRAIQVGAEHGIDVHTLTNRNEPQHEIDFPEAPDKYDLVTGPWHPRPEHWVFNVYTGRREPPGCGKCGECEQCLKQYTKELWDSLKEE